MKNQMKNIIQKQFKIILQNIYDICGIVGLHFVESINFIRGGFELLPQIRS